MVIPFAFPLIAGPLIATVWWSFLAALLAFTHAVRVASRRRVNVASIPSLLVCVARVSESVAWWRWPKLADVNSVTIRTSDELWKEAVTEFISIADVVVSTKQNRVRASIGNYMKLSDWFLNGY
jgi:hypothetical protein